MEKKLLIRDVSKILVIGIHVPREAVLTKFW